MACGPMPLPTTDLRVFGFGEQLKRARTIALISNDVLELFYPNKLDKKLKTFDVSDVGHAARVAAIYDTDGRR